MPDELEDKPQILPAVQVTDKGELLLEQVSPGTLNGEQLVFLAEVRSLAKRVEKHKPWARQEILLLLENAISAGVTAGNLEKGDVILKKAVEIYRRDILTRNRLRYVTGTALGVFALSILAMAVVFVAKAEWNAWFNLAEPRILIALFAFAGIGSVTSVLTRLSTLDLADETAKAMLFLSGASKPLVAISFASIVYIVIKYQLVSVSIGANTESTEAAFWVSAFLCGFSERFASDIIGRLEPSGDTANGKKTGTS